MKGHYNIGARARRRAARENRGHKPWVVTSARVLLFALVVSAFIVVKVLLSKGTHAPSLAVAPRALAAR